MLEKLFNLGNYFLFEHIRHMKHITYMKNSLWHVLCDMLRTCLHKIHFKGIYTVLSQCCGSLFFVLIILSKILWALYFVKYICTEHTPQYSHLCIIIDLKRHVGIYIWVLINLNPLIGETSLIYSIYSWTFYYFYHHYYYWQ